MKLLALLLCLSMSGTPAATASWRWPATHGPIRALPQADGPLRAVEVEATMTSTWRYTVRNLTGTPVLVTCGLLPSYDNARARLYWSEGGAGDPNPIPITNWLKTPTGVQWEVTVQPFQTVTSPEFISSTVHDVTILDRDFLRHLRFAPVTRARAMGGSSWSWSSPTPGGWVEADLDAVRTFRIEASYVD